MIEAIKLIGSIVGILTGGFVVVDRLLGNRPIVHLRRGEANAEFVVVNMSRENIFITKLRVSPLQWWIANTDDNRGVAFAALSAARREENINAFVILKPGEERGFPLGHLSSYSPLNSPVDIKVDWRKSGESWLPRRSLRLKTTEKFLSDIKGID